MVGVTRTNSVTTDTPVVTTAETAAVVSDPLTGSTDGAKYTISGVINITAGTATTAVVIRVRRGNGVAGTLVGETEPHTLAAGAQANIPYGVTDFPGAVGSQQYTASVVQTAATGNGAINNAYITIQTDT
jgi:hypothetical protein